MRFFTKEKKVLLTGFEPVFDERSEVLILGSFPSVKSRKEGFYYGNKRNNFWKILREYFHDDFGDGKEEKTEFLLKNKIALWDCVFACEIKGSSDSSIKNYVLADVNKIIRRSEIKRIFCNGKKSYELFIKGNEELSFMTVYLPSTSPANFSFDKYKWFAAFDEVFK